MPYVFITSKFPPSQTNELAKRYIEEIPKFRSAIRGLSKEIIPNAVKPTTEGIVVTGVHDIKEGKLEEFLIHQLKSMTAYQEVEGYSYSIEVMYKVTEALEVLGMKPPE
jgi:hypothetical protein